MLLENPRIRIVEVQEVADSELSRLQVLLPGRDVRSGSCRGAAPYSATASRTARVPASATASALGHKGQIHQAHNHRPRS